MFKDRKADIDSINRRGTSDGKFSNMIQYSGYCSNKLLALDEFWYRDTRKQQIIEDVVTGDSIEYFGEDDILEEFVAQDSNRTTRVIEVPTVRVAYSVNGEVFYDGANPYGHELMPIDRYPFVPVLAYYEPDISDLSLRMQGVCRGLRDAQYLYNRRKVIELDILESQINSGLIYEEDALVNPNDAFMTGQGKGLAIKTGRMGSVVKIDSARIDPNMVQMSELLGREIMEISGVNEELLGSASDDKAGILSMLRQGAGLTTLQKVYDQLDFSQKLVGNIMVEMVQANFREGKVQRIVNEEVSPQFRQKAFQKFDCEVEEGMDTTTQKQMQFAQMEILTSMGVPIAPEDLIEAATIQNKSEIIENMQRREQQQNQMQQQQTMMQIEVLKAQINDLNSRALANQGLGIERVSRVSENESLSEARHAQAIEDLQDAQLSKARTMKELSDMDLNQIERMLSIANLMKDDVIKDTEEAGMIESGVGDKIEALQLLQASSQQTQGMLNEGQPQQAQQQVM